MCIRDSSGVGAKYLPRYFDSKARTLQEAGILCKLNTRSILPSLNPVSYTHLDVYKRQVLGEEEDLG